MAEPCGTLVAGVIGAVVSVPLVAVTWTVWTALKDHPSRTPNVP